MLLWLNGLTAAPFKSVLDTLIDDYATKPLDLGMFLEEDEFRIQLKNAKPALIEFVNKQRFNIAH